LTTENKLLVILKEVKHKEKQIKNLESEIDRLINIKAPVMDGLVPASVQNSMKTSKEQFLTKELSQIMDKPEEEQLVSLDEYREILKKKKIEKDNLLKLNNHNNPEFNKNMNETK